MLEHRHEPRKPVTLSDVPRFVAIRSVHQDGIFRKEYEALLARNGNKKIPALMAIARKGLKLLFAVAKTERHWTPERPGARVQMSSVQGSGTSALTESR